MYRIYFHFGAVDTPYLFFILAVNSTLTGVETPDAIDLRKVQRKEPDDQAEMRLYKVLLI